MAEKSGRETTQKRDRTNTIVFWLIGIVTALFTVGAYLQVFRGLPPEPELTPIMDITQFRKPEEIGAVLYRRFWLEIRDHSTVVLGDDAQLPGHDAIWNGFKEVAQQYGVQFGAAKRLILLPSSDEQFEELAKSSPDAFAIFLAPLPVKQRERTATQLVCAKSKLACYGLTAIQQGKLHHPKANRFTSVIMQLRAKPNVQIVFVHGP